MTIGTADVIVAVPFVLRLKWIQENVRRFALDPELAMQLYKLFHIVELLPLGFLPTVKDRVNRRLIHSNGISHVIAATGKTMGGWSVICLRNSFFRTWAIIESSSDEGQTQSISFAEDMVTPH